MRLVENIKFKWVENIKLRQGEHQCEVDEEHQGQVGEKHQGKVGGENQGEFDREHKSERSPFQKTWESVLFLFPFHPLYSAMTYRFNKKRTLFKYKYIPDRTFNGNYLTALSV